MPVYLTRRDTDHHIQELEVPGITEASSHAASHGGRLAWPVSAAAATAELARDLADAGVTVQCHPDGLLLPDLAAGPGDTTGIRVHTTRRAPHALYVITATDLVPLTHSAGALAHLRPLIDAAARSCDGCLAEPGDCLSAPATA